MALFAGVWVDRVRKKPILIAADAARFALSSTRPTSRICRLMRFIVWGTMPLGALAAGGLGAALGLRTAVAVLAVGGLLAFAWVQFSPVRSLRDHPQVSPAP